MEERWHSVPASAFEGDRALVDVDGRELVVFLLEGRPHAFENACPHAGNPLLHAEVLGPTLTCVYHGWRFDLETGACLTGALPARRYPAEVRDGAVWIEVGGSGARRRAPSG